MKNRLILNIIGAILIIGGTVVRYYQPENKYALVCSMAGFAMVILIILRSTVRKK
ncbi:hypothetical protein [Pedobacter flavus]|uniref:Gliding motility protein GldL n=1 Tax=Pedobacter flavus TaxID=3113906 RepID=A0ABU7GYA1_9SPHI|nr:hypothetical protein [Pedobacter sp. VNH31]MEE1884032.1 hypothetical protein [Pedobacter sp. VNH31]